MVSSLTIARRAAMRVRARAQLVHLCSRAWLLNGQGGDAITLTNSTMNLKTVLVQAHIWGMTTSGSS